MREILPRTHSMALILMSADHAKPTINPESDSHHEWLDWPYMTSKSGLIRFLGLTTGMDWSAEDYLTTFRTGPSPDSFVPNAASELAERGYFKARQRWLSGVPVVPVSRPTATGAVSEKALLLALESKDESLTPVPYKGPFKGGTVYVFEAKDWNEQYELASRISGRVLTLVVPGQMDSTLQPFWTRGPGWPAGLPVDPDTHIAGYVRLHNALKLLLRPDDFEWKPLPDAVDSVPQWVSMVRGTGPALLFSFAILIIYVIGCAVYCIIKEQRGPVAASLLAVTLLCPPFFLIQGQLLRIWGFDQWLLSTVAAAAAVGSGFAIFNWGFRRLFPGASALLAICLVGSLASLFCPPEWSVFSGIFGFTGIQKSPEAIGLLVGYLTGFLAFLRGLSPETVVSSRLVTVAVLAGGFAMNAWWLYGTWQYGVFPVICLIAAEGVATWPVLVALIFVPISRLHLTSDPFTWAPTSSYTTADGPSAVNLGRYLNFFLSPALITFFTCAGGAWLFGDSFFMSKMKVQWQKPQIRAVPSAAACMAAVGIFNPVWLPAVTTLLLAALVGFAFEAVWTV